MSATTINAAMNTQHTQTQKTGTLKAVGNRRLGLAIYYYWMCIDCGTEFPDAETQCNGHQIGRCPWCRPDSKPWVNGRGK